MNSPRTAAKLCWIFTLVSFVGVGIGLYTTINTITYPFCDEFLPLNVATGHKDCPYCGKELD